MEAPEVPTEHLHEQIQEHARHGFPWNFGVALTSALLAALAAIASLKAGQYANEAMLAQIQAANKWNYYQAKGIKSAQLISKIEILTALGKTVGEKDQAKAGEYKTQQEDIKSEAEKLEHESEIHLHRHEVFARGVTLFQVAIAVAAISVLTRQKRFWMASIGFGIVGLYFLTQGFLIGLLH